MEKGRKRASYREGLVSKASPDAVAGLRRKVEAAVRDQRWNDAVDLGRTLVQNAPTEDHRDLVRSAALGFARSLAQRSRTRDLTAELPKLASLFPGDAAFAGELAEVAVGCGLMAEAAKLLPPGDAAAGERLNAALADAAVKQGAAGGRHLPAELQADHLRIVKALAFVEQGKDDDARAELQGVGLRSPFAEWRLFLRGLQAYYASDDARAVEAWSRLAPARLPFRLAAPLRVGIDPTFRDAQPPATRDALRKQARQLSDAGSLADSLRNLQQGIHEQRSLSREFSDLQTHKKALADLPADLRERLSRALYWALLPAPDDERRRYLRAFKPPAEDPKLHRLEALHRERLNDLFEAQTAWLAYEKEVSANRTLWGDDTDRVRVLLWLHAGQLATVPPEDLDEVGGFPFEIFGGRAPRRPTARPTQPAEECFRRARELGPDLVAAYAAPINHLRDQDRVEEARPLADELRQRFPENVDAQMTAAMVYADLDAVPDALACAEQAARVNPLDARVRQVRRAFAFALVLYHLRNKRADDARAALARAGELAESDADAKALKLLEATIAWKGGDPAAIEAFRLEEEKTLPKAVVLYQLVVQANAAGLDRKLRGPIDKEFKAVLDGELPLEDAMRLGRMVAAQGAFTDQPYHGYKSHRDKVVKKLAKPALGKLTPRQLVELGLLYRDLKAKRPLTQLANNVPRRVPQSFLFFLRYLKDQQSGPGFFGPVTHYLQYAEQHLDRVSNAEDREFLKGHIDREKAELDIDEFRDPFDLFGGDDFDDDFDDDEDYL